MGKKTNSNIILIGFSTTGKSRVGREVAKLLGWGFVDLDDDIVKLTDKPIAQIFAQEGEEYFRQIERQELARACKQKNVVVVTGGGAILDPRNRELMSRSGMVVCLEAKVETIYQRVVQDTAISGPLRPLLAVSDPLQRIQSLKEFRQPYYAIADWTIHTDNLTVEEVAQEIIRGWQYWSRSHSHEISYYQDPDFACEVRTATERYPVFVGWDLLGSLGKHMRQSGLSGAAYIISDEMVFPLYGAEAEKFLREAKYAVDFFVLPPGEATKSVDGAVRIYDFLVGHRAERGDTIIALGGGVIGDLAGFVAATFLRGLPLVQVPTSLIAMVDASVGGKVAVNHPQGKNLIGAFYQPHMVLVDVQALATLPRRELTSGWAEVIKHGLVLDPSLFEFLEKQTEGLKRLEPAATTEAIKRSVALKAAIVSEDEKERGRRTLLNYGHTIAHSLEAATGYQRFLHGEAVAIGMTGAALLSQRLGFLSSEIVERQRSLLRRFDLPISCSTIDLAGVLQAMELDKKMKGKSIRWVLLQDIGQPVIKDGVPAEDIIAILKELSVN